ncbi:MAG TPA: P-loop NTPase fold protein [Thermoanaerobaculia bacterium]|jgi:hypothetical protein
MGVSPAYVLLDDRPDEEPWQGLKDLAARLAERLSRYPASSPLLIGGEWGLGKTSLLWALRKKIEEEREKPRAEGQVIPPVILFEAWRYEGELPLLPALVRSLWTQIKGLDPATATKGKEIWKKLWESTVALAVGMGPGIAQVAFGPWAQAVFQGLLEVRKKGGETKTEELAWWMEDETQQLWDSFHDFVNLFWPDVDRPLIILIDDLDRCCPSGAVNLLDSIRVILGQASNLNCRFVVAMDRGVLSMAVAHKFADLGHYEGNRYLEKIFPISFDLPRPGRQDVASLIEALLKRLANHDHDKTDHLEVFHKAFLDPIFANPRLIKRCINRLLLLLKFEENDVKLKEDTKENELRRRITLVQWMAACERWPALRRLLSRRDVSYWEQAWEALRDPSRKLPDPDAEALLQEPDLKTWLSHRLAEGVQPLYEADQRLQRKGL